MMKNLKASEKLMIAVLGVIIFGFFNVALFRFLSRNQQQMRQQITQLANDRTVAQVLLDEAPMWKERIEWLDAHQPKAGSSGEASSRLFEFVTGAAKDAGVKLVRNPDFAADLVTPGTMDAAVRISATGSLEALSKWLVALQQPENFCAIPTFRLDSTQEQGVMKCELDLIQHFQASHETPES
jgi:hypothetical protein